MIQTDRLLRSHHLLRRWRFRPLPLSGPFAFDTDRLTFEVPSSFWPASDHVAQADLAFDIDRLMSEAPSAQVAQADREEWRNHMPWNPDDPFWHV